MCQFTKISIDSSERVCFRGRKFFFGCSCDDKSRSMTDTHPDKKKYNDLTYCCPRDARLSASWGLKSLVSLSYFEHHSAMVSGGLRGALNFVERSQRRYFFPILADTHPSLFTCHRDWNFYSHSVASHTRSLKPLGTIVVRYVKSSMGVHN